MNKISYPLNETIRGLKLISRTHFTDTFYALCWITPAKKEYYIFPKLSFEVAQRAMGILLEVADWEHTFASHIRPMEGFDYKTQIRIIHALHLIETENELKDENLYVSDVDGAKGYTKKLLKENPR